jgi:integral membrane sensor domain MASE1
VGDSIGVMLALPLIVNLGRERLPAKHQYYELLAWLAIFVIGELLILLLVPSLNKQFMVSIFLVLPILIWVSMNFGIVGGSLLVITMSAIVVWFTAHGHGSFYSQDLSEGVFSLWTFMTALIITMLLISVLQSERNQAEKALSDSEKNYER